jgi:peptide/nickel transport system substrate-binding protein
MMAYEPLIKLSTEGKYVPGLATKWGFAPGSNNTKFDITLRHGVRFSDGSKLTAKALKKSFEYAEHVQQKIHQDCLPNVKGFKVTGPLSVEVTFSKPTGARALFAFSGQGCVYGWVAGPKGLAHPKKLASSTDGAGPYMLDTDATVQNSKYVYVPNPHYYDKSKIHYHRVVFKVMTDASTTLAALKSGQVQVAQGDPSTASAAKAAGLTITAKPTQQFAILITDPGGKKIPALGKLKVRRALNYAIDRKAINKAIFGKYYTPTQESVGPGGVGYDATLASYYNFDPKKAKRLMAQAGYADGFTATALAANVDESAQIIQAVQQYWKKIGVKLHIVSVPIDQWITDVQTKKWAFNSLRLVQQVPQDALGYYGKGGTVNYFNYSYPKLSALGNELDVAKVTGGLNGALYRHFESALLKKALYVPVALADMIFYSKGVGGISYSTNQPVPDPADWYPTGG